MFYLQDLMPNSSNFPVGTTIYAPGKLVIAGDYAILDDAPAISLAINRGVKCEISSFRKNSPICNTPTGDDRFVSPALKNISNPHFYNFQDWNPVSELHEKQKPGFGGSAAACVASCYVAGIPLNQAFQIHHQVQGSGSGIDIATSIYGNMIWAENKDYRQLPPLLPIVIWTGNSAKTGPRIRTYRQWKNRDFFLQESKYWTKNFVEAPVLATQKLYQNLCNMAQKSGLDYLTKNIVDIVDLAEFYGGGAKPSGAGGGDCVIAFFPDEMTQSEFIKSCQEKYPIIPISISKGVHHMYPQSNSML